MAERGIAMINNISEGSFRNISKLETSGPTQEKELNLQKTEQVRQVRPIEKTESGARNEKKRGKKEPSSKYVVNENKLVFEKYDKNGDLILRLPPSRKPVDQRA